MLKPLSLRVKELLPEAVVVTTPDGQAITLPQTAIHGTPKLGQTLRLIAVAPGAEDAGTTAFAQALLDELLSS